MFCKTLLKIKNKNVEKINNKCQRLEVGNEIWYVFKYLKNEYSTGMPETMKKVIRCDVHIIDEDYKIHRKFKRITNVEFWEKVNIGRSIGIKNKG